MSNTKASEAAIKKTPSASHSPEKFKQLKDILRGMFQLDRRALTEVIGVPSERSENR